MKQKRKLFILMLAAAMVMAMCCLAGCGQKKDVPASKKTSGNKTQTYDGYAYCLDNGKDGFSMHCFFQSDSPEYTEVVYKMDLDSAVRTGDTLTIKKIRDENGNDISDKYKKLTYTFGDGKVIMKVECDESKLAGGGGDNILSGKYVFTAPAEKSPKKKASDAGADSSDARTKYTAAELGKLAQKYYKKKNDFYPPQADVTKNSDGTFTIHLYEKVDNGDGTYHTATSAWYRVNEYGAGKNEITNEKVDITE